MGAKPETSLPGGRVYASVYLHRKEHPLTGREEHLMRRLKRDEVALTYEEAGEGEPPVLLVHGWCCDHSISRPSSGT
jgi:hypothetical protein